jgi:hypothetical protein
MPVRDRVALPTMGAMKLYGRFAAAWGTLWLAMFALALLTRTHVNLDTGGTFFVLLGCGIYAALRAAHDKKQPDRLQVLEQENASLRAWFQQQHAHAAAPPSPPVAAPPVASPPV